ncbi:IDEAL domain-containing protein [Paenibacillus sp. FSL L8-0709]|uniref:IDEAL domain-containing protein n=1 Tax=Paenibacillus sp. FSL L8-0709 TaxID=2975312 RepID=UPI0030F9055C
MFFIGLYALALNSYIEVVWETAVRNYRIEQLQEQIDLALDKWDAAAFYQYSAELAELKVVQAHGQIIYKR